MTCRPIFLRKTHHTWSGPAHATACRTSCGRRHGIATSSGFSEFSTSWGDAHGNLLGWTDVIGISTEHFTYVIYLKIWKKQGVGRVCFVSVHLPRSSWWCSKHLMWYCEVLVTICVDHVLRCSGVPHMSLMKQNILSQVELGHLVVETARLTPLCVHSISLLQSCLSNAHRCSTLFHCHLGWETSVSPERMKWFAWWEVGSFSNLFLLQLPQKDLESILFCFRKQSWQWYQDYNMSGYPSHQPQVSFGHQPCDSGDCNLACASWNHRPHLLGEGMYQRNHWTAAATI